MLISDCINAASKAFNIGTPALRSGCKAFPVSHARFAAMYLARQHGFSTTRIAAAMKLDHTSVIHGSRRALVLAAKDEEYALKLATAMGEI